MEGVLRNSLPPRIQGWSPTLTNFKALTGISWKRYYSLGHLFPATSKGYSITIRGDEDGVRNIFRDLGGFDPVIFPRPRFLGCGHMSPTPTSWFPRSQAWDTSCSVIRRHCSCLSPVRYLLPRILQDDPRILNRTSKQSLYCLFT